MCYHNHHVRVGFCIPPRESLEKDTQTFRSHGLDNRYSRNSSGLTKMCCDGGQRRVTSIMNKSTLLLSEPSCTFACCIFKAFESKKLESVRAAVDHCLCCVTPRIGTRNLGSYLYSSHLSRTVHVSRPQPPCRLQAPLPFVPRKENRQAFR